MNKEIRKVVFITGCSRGIGYAIVELLAKENFIIYAGVRSIHTATKLKVLAQKYSNIKIVEIDLKNESSIKKIAKKIKRENIKIDVLINNAGIIVFGPVETVSMKQFHEQFQVNLFGPVLLTQELLPLMRKQKSGHIIFLGSTSGVESHGMYGAYAASKFALEAICHSLAVNLYRWNIKVSLVELTATKTSIAKKSIKTGNRLQRKKNPYVLYTQNSLVFLQELLANGTSPQNIAKTVLDVIEKPKSQLRCFATPRSKSVFESTLYDYLGRAWNTEAKGALSLFE